MILIISQEKWVLVSGRQHVFIVCILQKGTRDENEEVWVCLFFVDLYLLSCKKNYLGVASLVSSGVSLWKDVASSLFKNPISSSPVGEVFLRRQSRCSFACAGDRKASPDVFVKCLSDMNELLHRDHAEIATHDDSLESSPSVSCSLLSLSFLPYPIQTFVSVSFHTHHNQKASSRLNIESHLIPPSCHIWHAWACLIYTHYLWSEQLFSRVLGLEVSHSPPVSLPSPSPGPPTHTTSPSAVNAAVYFHSAEINRKWLHQMSYILL